MCIFSVKEMCSLTSVKIIIYELILYLETFKYSMCPLQGLVQFSAILPLICRLYPPFKIAFTSLSLNTTVCSVPIYRASSYEMSPGCAICTERVLEFNLHNLCGHQDSHKGHSTQSRETLNRGKPQVVIKPLHVWSRLDQLGIRHFDSSPGRRHW